MFRNKEIIHSRSGSVAVEFAIIGPIFIILIAGIIEIGIVLLFNLYLNAATNSGVEYLRKSQINRVAITSTGLRDAISRAMPVELDRKKLHVSLVPIPNADLTKVVVAFPVGDSFSLSTTGDYLLQVGYDWSALSPVTKYLVPNASGKIQLQAIHLGAAAVRVTE